MSNKPIIFGVALLIIVTLFTACGIAPPVEPTPTPTLEPTPTLVPEPTLYPEKWRWAVVEDEHSFHEPTGELNNKGYPLMDNAFVGKAEVGDKFLCKWPIQGDGEKFCEIAIGDFAGYFLRVRKIVWVDG